MRMEINWFEISHYKAIVHLEHHCKGNVELRGMNATTKTTVYDSFLWLFFNKDSKGRTDYNTVPHKLNSTELKRGLTTSVKYGVLIDGIERVFRKDQKENLVKKTGQVVGYVSSYWIDEVPMLLKDYKTEIAKIISEDLFRKLSDVSYFCEIMAWKECRKVLMTMAGDKVTVPKGYEQLKAELKGRTIEDFKKVLKERKKADNDELILIPPRIDEKVRGLSQPDFDPTEQETARINAETELLKVKNAKAKLRTQEDKRQDELDHINTLKGDQIRREGVLATDYSAVQGLIDEKQEMNIKAGQQLLVNDADATVSTLRNTIRKMNLDADTLRNCKQSVLTEKTGLEAQKTQTVCILCKQNLPAKTVKASEAAAKVHVTKLEDQLAKYNKGITGQETAISGIEIKLSAAQQIHDKAFALLTEMVVAGKKRVAEINEEIKSCPTPQPGKDETWLNLQADIEKAEKELGLSVTIKLAVLDKKQEDAQEKLDDINEVLSQSDTFQKDKDRIQVLKGDETRLSQAVADSEKLLNDIDLYTADESMMINRAVSGYFKYTQWRMFKPLLGSDGLEECCEAVLKGTVYGGMSTGEGVFIGADIINTLSKFYDTWVPLFIDRAESLTMPLENETQIFRLVVDESVKKLQVTDAR